MVEKKFKENIGKGGISPLVATVILIGFVVVIIVVIWLWSRNIYVEQAQKEGALAQEQIKCNDVQIEVERIGGNIDAKNIGGIDLDGFVLREDLGSSVRVSNIYTKVEIGSSFTLFKSSVSCSESEEPDTPGALCSNSKDVSITPALQPEGRGAPLVPCRNANIGVDLE